MHITKVRYSKPMRSLIATLVTLAVLVSSLLTGVQPIFADPLVNAVWPTGNNSGLGFSIGTQPYVTFSEAMDPATISSSTVQLSMVGGGVVAATVTMAEGNTRAMLTPVNIVLGAPSTLSYSTSYYIIVTTGARNLAGIPLAPTFMGNATPFTTVATDTTPPLFSDQYPLHLATGVAVGVNPYIDFNEPMLATSISSKNVILKDSGGVAVAASVLVAEGNNKRAIIIPSVALKSNAVYYLYAAGVQDAAGNNLASPWGSVTDSQFTTGVPPTVVSAKITGAHQITVVYSEAVTSLSTDYTNLVLTTGLLHRNVTAVSVSTNTVVLTFDGSGVKPNETATMDIGSTVKDTSASTNALVAVTGQIVTDGQPPTVNAVSPTGAFQSPGIQPYVDFIEAMDPATISSTTVKLMQGASQITSVVTMAEGNTRALLTPISNLDWNTIYHIEVTMGATDSAGNALASAYNIGGGVTSFTTATQHIDTPPTVLSQYPAPGAIGVAVGVNPYVDFSEEMTPKSLYSASVQLLPSLGGLPVTATVVAAEGNTRAIIIPSVALAPNTKYYLYLGNNPMAGAVMDLAFNPMASPYGSTDPVVSSFSQFMTAKTPTVVITSPAPGSVVSGATQAIDFTTNTGVGIKANVSVDGGSFSTTGISNTGGHGRFTWDTTGLANGTHTIQIKDTVSSVDGYSSTVSYVVNNGNNPTIAVTNPIAGHAYAFGDTINLDYTFSPAGAVQTASYSLDGGSWTSQATNYNMTSLVTIGTHTLQLKTTNVVGGITFTGYSTIVTFVRNANTAPSVIITTPAPGSVVSGATQAIDFTTNTGVGITANVSVDGGSFSTTGISNTGGHGRFTWDTTGLANGTHIIQIKDTISSVDGYSSTVSYVVNNGNVPTVTWTTPTPNQTYAYGDTIAVAYTIGNGGVTDEFSLDGSAWSAISSPTTITPTIGTHTILLRSNKVVGGITYTGYSTVVTFVRSAATLSITTPTGGAVVTGSVTVTAATATDYQIDGGAWVAYGTAWDTTAIVNGSHTIKARNTGVAPTVFSDTITVVVDNGNVPSFSGFTPAPGAALAYTIATNSSWTVSNYDTGTVSYSINGGAWAAATTDTTKTGIAVNIGLNALQLKATKTVQGVITTGYSAIIPFVINAQNAPAVIVTLPTAGSTVSGAAVVITATTNGIAPTAAALYEIDGSGAWVAYGTAWNTSTLTNGSHTIRVQDTVSGTTGYSTAIIAVVNNGNVPTVTWTTPTPNQTYAYGDTIAVAFTIGNGGVTNEFSLDGSTWSAISSPTTITPTVGTHTIQLRSSNVVGGITYTGYSTITTFVKNAAALSITAPTGGTTVSGNQTITALTATDYQIDGGTWVAYGAAWDTTSVADGSHSIRARNTAVTPTVYSDTITVVVNNTNTPTITWTTPVPGTTLPYATTVDSSWTIGGTYDAGSVQYSINGSAWAGAPANTSKTGIAVQVGTNTLALKATKTVGGVVYTGYSTINTFIISTQAPIVTITYPADGAVVSGATLLITATNGDSYQIDGGGWISPITNVWDTTGFANGSEHTIRAKGTISGATGYSNIITVVANNGVSVPIFTWLTPVSGSSFAYITTVDATYNVTNYDINTVEYSVNNAAWATAGNASQPNIPVTIGTNTLKLRATKTGVYGYSTINTFIVNALSAPTVTITAPVAGAVVSGAAVGLTATNGDNYQIDGGTWVAPIATWDTTVLANGSHTIRAKGTSGGATGYSDAITVVVDNGNVPIFSGFTPAPGAALAYTTATNASWTVTNYATGTVQYSINGGTWTAADSDTAKAAMPVQVALNTLQLKATKTVQGVTATGYSALIPFVINAQNSPTVIVTGPAAGSPVSGAAVAITATTNNVAPTAAAFYEIDGSGVWVAYGTAWNTTGLINGSHIVRVQDTVGVTAGYSTSIVVVVNNGNTPSFVWTTPVPGSSIANTASVNATYTVNNFDGGTVQYSINGAAWAVAADATQPGITVQAGTNTLQIKATKTVGGVVYTGYSAVNTFVVNAYNAPSAPIVVITAPTAGAIVSGSASVTFTTNGGTTTAAYVSLDGGSYTAATTNADPGTYSWDTTSFANGTHTIQAKDTVSSVSGYSAIVYVTINNDNTPTFTWTTPTPGSTLAYAATVNTTYTATNYDPGTVKYSVNGGSWSTAGNASQNSIPVQPGTNLLQLKATKTIGGIVYTGYSSITAFSITSPASGGGPTISNIQILNITSTTATITWTTNVASSNNSVAYGLTYSLGSSQVTSTGDGVTSNSASLTGLTPNSTQYFQILSTSIGQTSLAGIYSFVTPAADSGIAVSIQILKASANADNTFTNGWEFKFNITDYANTDTALQMKFNDWVGWLGTGNNVGANGNMKIALTDDVAGVQAGTLGVAVGNNYTDEPTTLALVDHDPNVGGIQTSIYVYVKIPVTSSGGSYSTTYGIHTQ